MNPYEILELSKECTAKEIKKSYRKLVFKHHPDRGGDVKIFREIQTAYEVLIDPDEQGIIVDDNDSNQLKSRAFQLFKDLVTGWIEQNLVTETNLTEYFNDHIAEENTRMNNVLRDVKKKIINLNNLIKRVKTNEDENVVVKLIKQKIDEAERNITHVSKELMILDHIREVCSKYSSEELLQTELNDFNLHNFSQFFMVVLS